MRNFVFFILIFLILSGCGIAFKTQTLEDPKAKYYKPLIGLGDFRATSVFKDSKNDAWGIEKDECQNVRHVTEPTFDGDGALVLEWDRGGCEWAGMGIGWNGWESKDLSDIMDVGAFQFKIRAVKDVTTIPTIIFLLEDYSGVMSAAVFGSSCIESYPINEEWQTATVPLKSFNYKEQGIDLTNIKQLVLEFQNSGALMVDEMEIVLWSETDRKLEKKEYPKSKIPLADSPINVFKDEFVNVWGFEKNDCRNFEISNSNVHSGDKCIHMSWNANEDCKWLNWGTSWSNWLAVDISKQLQTGRIEFYLRNEQKKTGKINMQIGLEAYNYANKWVELGPHYVEGNLYDNQWRKVSIPLEDFKIEDSDFPSDQVKQLMFKVEKNGDVFIDDIQIVYDEM